MERAEIVGLVLTREIRVPGNWILTQICSLRKEVNQEVRQIKTNLLSGGVQRRYQMGQREVSRYL